MTDLNNVPFAKDCTAQLPALNNRHRLKIYRKFIGVEKFGEHLRVLDMGRSNYIGRELGIEEDTGEIDFSYPFVRSIGQYDIVTAFEVLNHSRNAEIFAQNCYNNLCAGGVLYLATPLPKYLYWLHGNENFTEYRKTAVEQLFRYVGFTPVKYEVHSPFPWYFMFWGWRPFWRVMFHRFQIWQFYRP